MLVSKQNFRLPTASATSDFSINNSDDDKCNTGIFKESAWYDCSLNGQSQFQVFTFFSSMLLALLLRGYFYYKFFCLRISFTNQICEYKNSSF